MKKFNVVVSNNFGEVVKETVVDGVDILDVVKKFRRLDGGEFCLNDKDLAEWHNEDEITDDVLLGLIDVFCDSVYYVMLAEEFMFDFVEI